MMRNLRITACITITLCLLLAVSCKQETGTKKVVSQEITFTKEGDLIIMKPDSTTLLKLEIEIADNDYEIQTGLMYRTKMREDRGMLFIFPEQKPRYFYMKNTEIALDLIYIDENNHIADLFKKATPFDESTLPASAPAKYVLEINAGLIDKYNITLGDIIWFGRD